MIATTDKIKTLSIAGSGLEVSDKQTLDMGREVKRVCRRNRFEKLPPNTKLVTRPSKWGNPHKCDPTRAGRAAAVAAFEADLIAGLLAITIEDVRRELRGFNLACACPVGDPRHADVLLRVANDVNGGHP
jgi:hypothetical protein